MKQEKITHPAIAKWWQAIWSRSHWEPSTYSCSTKVVSTLMNCESESVIPHSAIIEVQAILIIGKCWYMMLGKCFNFVYWFWNAENFRKQEICTLDTSKSALPISWKGNSNCPFHHIPLDISHHSSSFEMQPAFNKNKGMSNFRVLDGLLQGVEA